MPGMEDFHNGSEGSFNSEEADSVVKECIESVVGADDYSQNQVNKWTASIVERCLTQLMKQGKAYKYIVTCAVMQKTGAGLHTANSCYWDTTMDGKVALQEQFITQTSVVVKTTLTKTKTYPRPESRPRTINISEKPSSCV
uniref:Dynein light chain Tctex-type 3 n=1 Tax=Labrus bergylta TaxID=56723 RepID=A0A3Q3F6U2_9LABR